MLDALLSDMIGDELLRNPSFIQTPLEDYCRKLANRASIIIHFDSQKPLGMIDLKTGSVYISSIIVDPEARRGGVGQRLVRAAIDHGKSLGFQRCELEVSAANTQAIRFYQKLGFGRSDNQMGLMQCPI